jgi:hypothetical protein
MDAIFTVKLDMMKSRLRKDRNSKRIYDVRGQQARARR